MKIYITYNIHGHSPQKADTEIGSVFEDRQDAEEYVDKHDNLWFLERRVIPESNKAFKASIASIEKRLDTLELDNQYR